MSADLEITGATLVEPEGRRQVTIAVEDGRVSALLPGPSGRASRTIDADGLLALPGMIDEHVHFMDPGDTSREDFVCGSAAAAAGGITTVVEHTHGSPVLTAADLRAKAEHLRARSHVDFGLAAHVFPESIHRVAELCAAGVAMFKCFMCTTHGVPGLSASQLLALLRVAAAHDARVLVHCEDESITAAAEAQLRSDLREDAGIIPAWRSSEAELVATATVALLARLTGARVTIAHASQPDVVDLVARERALGARLTVECCPQYLLISEAEVVRLGATRKFTPPARPEPAGERLWQALASGRIDVMASDHAPSTLAQKAAGSIWECPFGLPGVDTTLTLLLDAAHRGQISLERVVEVYSRAPARELGLGARKGTLAPGADADIVLVDPTARWVIRDEGIRSRAGWSPYAGRAVTGRVELTLVRGAVVYAHGRIESAPGAGRQVAA